MPSGIRRRRAARSGDHVVVKKKPRRQSKNRVSRNLQLNNPIIAANWDPKLTLAQNYEKLGLTAHVQKPTGGATSGTTDAVIKSSTVKVARITRNEDGSTKIEYPEEADLDEPLPPKPAKTEVVKQLEEYSTTHKKKYESRQSAEEKEWLEQLIAKHDDDYQAMQWDKRLNQLQHSAGTLKKKIREYRANQ